MAPLGAPALAISALTAERCGTVKPLGAPALSHLTAERCGTVKPSSVLFHSPAPAETLPGASAARRQCGSRTHGPYYLTVLRRCRLLAEAWESLGVRSLGVRIMALPSSR